MHYPNICIWLTHTIASDKILFGCMAYVHIVACFNLSPPGVSPPILLVTHGSSTAASGWDEIGN